MVSDNGLSPIRDQAIFCTNAGSLLIVFCIVILWNSNQNTKIVIQENVFENVNRQWRPYGFNVLNI